MAVSGVGSSFLQGMNLMEMLRSLQKSAKDMLGEAGAASLASLVSAAPLPLPDASASANAMAGNFASAPSSESRYMAAAKQSFVVAKQQNIQETGRVAALLETLGGYQGPQLYDGVDSKRSIPEATVQLALKRIRDTVVQETSERNLEEIRDGIEKNAAEATAPKDENGDPIEGLTTEDAEVTAAPPEISAPPPDAESAELLQEAPSQPSAIDAAIAAYTVVPSIPSPAGILAVV